MSEHIELHTFCVNSINDDVIEEYHEINEHIAETFSSNIPSKTVKEYNFFTQYDVESIQKKENGTGKKKKIKKKEGRQNLMDIISSELAAMATPVENNVITIIDYSQEQRNGYLERKPRIKSLFQKYKPWHSDYEHGRGHKSHINLTPTFPKVLENAVTEDHNIPIQYIEPAMYTDIIANNLESESTQNAKFLDISLKNIRFKHHHKYSLEELLCVKLIENYYEHVNVQNLLESLSKEIKIIKETKDNVKTEFSKISHKKEDVRFDPTIRKYTGKLIDLKEKYLEAIANKKEVIHKLISLWFDIEMVREKSGCIKTPYTLQIIRNALDHTDNEENWSEIFTVEFNDMLDKIEFEYVNKYIEYKEAKKNNKLDNSENRNIKKPKLQIDEVVLKQEAEEIVNNIIKKDEINVFLINDESILSNTGKPGKHEYYFKIYVDDVFVCQSEYFMSNNNTLATIEFIESFSVQILPGNIILDIILNEDREEISFLKINLSEIKSNDFNVFTMKKFVYNSIVEPNSKHVGSGHNIKEIASANKVRLRSSNAFKGKLYTTCEVMMKLGWNENLNQNQSEAIKSSMEIGKQLKNLLQGVDRPSAGLLKDIIEEMYGKDIGDDDSIINTIRDLCKQDVKVDDTFPIVEASPDFTRLKLLHLRNIGGFLDIENKLVPVHASQISTEQLNCLQKSIDGEFKYQHYSDKFSEMDPVELQRFIGAKYVQKLNNNMIKNLNEHLLKKTHKDVVRDFKDLSLRNLFSNQSSIATLASMSSSTKQKLLSQSLTQEQEIHVTVLRAFNLLDRTLLDEDEENDDKIAGFKVRPLRPFVRIAYLKSSVKTATAIGCHPTWNQTIKIHTKLEPLSSININLYDECKVNISEDYPDEEQSFHSKTVHYRYYNKWLGTLQVPLHSVLAMGSLRGTFKIHTPPLLLGYENLSQEKHSSQSLIPQVTQLMKKEASFLSLQITTNLSHLGDLQGYNQPIPSNPEDYLIKHLNQFLTEYTNNFPSRNITLTFIDSSGKNKCVTQFLQLIPLPDVDCFPKNRKMRSESALSKSSGLSKSSSSKNSSKTTLTTVKKDTDVEKGSPIKSEEQKEIEKESIYSVYEESKWRSGETQLSKAMTSCLRYVSLIPTYEVTETHVVTLLGLELLKVLHGSPLDHTILLCSYFLYLGIKCYIATGVGLPRGLSSYILTKYNLETHKMILSNDQLKSKGIFSKSDGFVWYVYDAVVGERYELRDVSCPLKTVDYVFDNENIWVNVQASQDCESMSFDFSRSSDWQPVFDKTIFVMKQPIVNDTSLYSAATDVEKLRLDLEGKIKTKIQKWRSHMKTIWNRYCGSLLREMLPYWEYWSFNSTEPKPGFSQRLKQLMVTYKMFGFPLNMAYVNTKSVISALKSSAIHVNDDPSIEFGLGVELYAYPNNVISVWVFLASITRI